MDPTPAGGNNRRRGKRNKNKNNRRKKGPGKGRGQRNNRQQQQAWTAPPITRDDSSVLGGRVPKERERRPVKTEGPPDGFALFCAYHLGITPDDGYREPRLEEVARRFGMPTDEVVRLLKEHKLDDKTLRASKFDLKGAQLDIRVCPEGISRTETARELYDEYLESCA